MRRLILGHTTEFTLLVVMVLLCTGLSFATDRFLTISNAFDVLNVSAVNIIFAVGLLVVLISGGIDISFAVAASVVQYVTVLALNALGGGNWAEGFIIAGAVGLSLGFVNAFLVWRLNIISIVATISTFNIFFGLLMFFTKGVSIYDLPEWLSTRVVFYEREMSDGSWVELTLPVVVMILCCFATWFMISRTTVGRKLYAFGDNPEGARRFGINIGAMHYISFGWLGLMAGIAGLMQAHYAQEVVPNALYGRELDVLAATVLGGARLGGGKGSVIGCVLGVLMVSITQNGLNLMGVSPFAFKMIVGAIILIAITLSSTRFDKLLPSALRTSAKKGSAQR
ncbi:ABC transporter permease [Agrobacterium leguminum]|uniref:ABC transporter, membrane spanning protein (Sugar) n=2 Tax=Agrobacterium TaxID=357 RepID=A0A1S7TS22_9HYPH|nr:MULTISPECIES: ABC transporter permease [Agrobacterium]MCZ7911735.1 ABC transporter permease [Agrobacterium leguminum]MCZ7933878.1 ABC transporter permease [Agrobacterium leguminum]WFS69245.1 ABC transporter permease [Agrobacterium leguminum]CVI57414.1 ABC transporter, membrane spanning protein (Sugar) [Agrobacterium deltaense NCPPB 1641]